MRYTVVCNARFLCGVWHVIPAYDVQPWVFFYGTRKKRGEFLSVDEMFGIKKCCARP